MRISHLTHAKDSFVALQWRRSLNVMSKIAIVTGANQGLGFALTRGLAEQLEPRDVVYLTGRDRARVDAARGRLTNARADVRGRVLDVRDPAAVDALAAEIVRAHGGVDIVFSNHYQRVMPSDDPAEVVADYVDTNNLGTTRVLRAFAPVLRRGGRLLVVASTLGTLNELPAELHSRFDTDTMTLDDVDAAVLAWRDAVVDGRADDDGWPRFINIPSKVGQVAAVRVLARDRRDADVQDGTLVAAVCPGMIDTGASRPWFDMTHAQTPAAAAMAPLRLALDPVDPRFHGELIRFGEVLAWGAEPEPAATTAH
jgi:NAD(P)-dependent dehydrogenase (short-subunit alcohol dehydrogenase family)